MVARFDIPPPGAGEVGTREVDVGLTPNRIERSEEELLCLFHECEAAMGLKGIGFDGGAQSVWDDARSARAHGFHIGDVGDHWLIVSEKGGRAGLRHRTMVERERRILRAFTRLDVADRNTIAAAWATVGATWVAPRTADDEEGSRVMKNFNSRDYTAPLVGLGLVIWFERKPDDGRSPIAVLAQWEQLCVNKASIVSELRRAAENRYRPALTRYNEIREARNEADGEGRRSRDEARRKRNEEFRSRLRGDS